MKRWLSLRLFALLAISGVVLVGCRTATNPPPAIDAAALFLQNCSPCHGTEREGIIAPSLKTADLRQRNRSDSYIRETITNGRGGMPAWKDRLTLAEIEALIKFLKK